MIKEMCPLFLDIETTCTVDPDVVQRIAERIKAPGNMSKPETIAKWERENKPEAVLEAVSKTALDGTYGQIVCMGFAVDDGEIQTFTGPEDELLTALMRTPCDHGAFPRMVGHNLAAFDLPFIRQRCIIHGVKMAPWFPRDFKPWSDRICDTMVVWSGRDFIGLERLAHALGIEMAETIAGKDIPAAYHEGRLDEIIAHNAEDIRVTREIYRRIVAVE